MKIEVPIRAVLETLQKNFADHRQELKEAMLGWNLEVHEALDAVAQAVDSKGLKADISTLYRLFHEKPQDNREEYARHIAALETASTYSQVSVQMTVEEHDELMRDNFSWRERSKIANIGYSAKAKGIDSSDL